MSVTVGVDVGGTFTDLFWSEGERSGILKVPSTPGDPSRGLIDAISRSGIAPASIGDLLHGTTIATNAIIERAGARCALVTTKGFRDVLELGRRDRPTMFGMTGVQDPLVPRALRWEVDERLDHAGNVVRPLDEAEVERLAGALLRSDVQVVVVSLFHAYANPDHEREVRRILGRIAPELPVVLSTDVLREYYEFERTSTAVVQGYLQPLISSYGERLIARLNEIGLSAPALVMQSNGGLLPVSDLADRAASLVRSGPAAGVIAAARLASRAGFQRVITGDMGGTSFDVAVVVDGVPEVAATTNLHFRVPLRVPMIDVHTIGAGGGSIAWIDRGGMLQIGPRSAGATPGPALYGNGGSEPTVTDANAVLGRINADRPIGVGKPFDLDAARRVVGGLGRKMGLDTETTAAAIIEVVNQSMAGRIRLMTIERGYDPRDFALVAFGGAGPLHCAALVRDVGIRTLFVPPFPGVLCAMGCALADIQFDYSQTVEIASADADIAALRSVFDRHREQGTAKIAASQVAIERLEARYFAQMCYAGQLHTVRVAIDPDWSLSRWEDEFRKAYVVAFGAPLDGFRISIVSIGTSVIGVRPVQETVAQVGQDASPPVPSARRAVYFDGWVDTPIYERSALRAGQAFAGPAIVEQADTTTVINPGMSARIDAYANLLVEVA